MDPSKWDRDACAQWVGDLGFPQYKVCPSAVPLGDGGWRCAARNAWRVIHFGWCVLVQEAFRTNLNGRRIMGLDAKGLTRMGIRYHEDQKVRGQWWAASHLCAVPVGWYLVR